MNYKITMSKNDFFKLHNRIATKNLEIKEEIVNFECELGTLNIIKESKYKYKLQDSFKIRFNVFMKKYYLLMIGIVFLFSIVYINSYKVNKIIFSNETPINDEIKSDLEKRYRHFLFSNYLSIDYIKYSQNLRFKYSEYPFIDVYAKSNNIYVDIYDYNQDFPMSNQMISGDIVAKKDGIINSFIVYQGDNIIYKNKYVKAGDILISGQLTNNTVCAKGLVLAYTYEKVTIKIEKEQTEYQLGSRYENYHLINIFGKDIILGRNNNYSLSEITSNNIFNLFDVISIKEIEEIEKNAIINTYTKEDAEVIARNRIIDNFESNKISSLENIIDLKTYIINDYDNGYEFVFIVKKLESIGKFVKY